MADQPQPGRTVPNAQHIAARHSARPLSVAGTVRPAGVTYLVALVAQGLHYTTPPPAAIMHVTKLQRLRDYMAAGDHRAALKLAAGWGSLGDHKEAISRGWEAMARPDFYRDIGHDPEAHVAAGLAAIRERYDIP